MSVLAQRLIATHRALDAGAVPHAFGGAIALAYCTGEPRGTQDLDINIFLQSAAARVALAALPPEVTITERNRLQASETGQTRIWWETTPLDIFLNTHAFHEIVADRVRYVDFDSVRIPVLDCFSLAVFKAMFNRTKDWADLEQMAEVGELPVDSVIAEVASLLGNDDARIDRLSTLRYVDRP
jgi:hypothetical protein